MYDSGEEKIHQVALDTVPDDERQRAQRRRQKQRGSFLKNMSEPQGAGAASDAGGRQGGEVRGQRQQGAQKLSFEELKEIFGLLDKDGDGSITHTECIIGLKKYGWIADKLGMPSNIRQEDGSRESYQVIFGRIDHDSSKTIEFEEVSKRVLLLCCEEGGRVESACKPRVQRMQMD